MLNKKEIEALRESVAGTKSIMDPNVDKIISDEIDKMPIAMARIYKAHLRGRSYFDIAKTYEVDEKYVRSTINRAARKMRCPYIYTLVTMGYPGYLSYHKKETTKHSAKFITAGTALSTKTIRVLQKNGLETYKLIKDYVDSFSEAMACIPGLGKIGMSEVYSYLKD